MPTAEKITTSQMRHLHGLLRQHGISGDKAVHDYLTVALGKPVESRAELTKAQADTVMAELEANPPIPVHHSLAAALCAFQAEMPKVHKGKTANIPSKDGGRGYSYTYADLADVSEAATPLLVRHGLAFMWTPRQNPQGSYEVAGVLLHTSGDREEGSLPLTGHGAQELGSAITYARRYLFGCMTGVITDDDDGSTAMRDTAPTRVQTPENAEAIDRLIALAAKADPPTDLEGITQKYRERLGGLPVEELRYAPPERLHELADSVEHYMAEHTAKQDQPA